MAGTGVNGLKGVFTNTHDLLNFKLKEQGGGAKKSLADFQFFQVLEEMQFSTLFCAGFHHNIKSSNTFLEKTCFQSML